MMLLDYYHKDYMHTLTTVPRFLWTVSTPTINSTFTNRNDARSFLRTYRSNHDVPGNTISVDRRSVGVAVSVRL